MDVLSEDLAVLLTGISLSVCIELKFQISHQYLN